MTYSKNMDLITVMSLVKTTLKLFDEEYETTDVMICGKMFETQKAEMELEIALATHRCRS